MTSLKWLSILLVTLVAATTAQAQTYVGPNKCKMCHDKEEIGNQHAAWQKTKHAHAYASLGTPKAKEAGAALGVKEPQKDKKCLICHTTAYDAADDQKEGIKLEDGVSCEACHGPGSEYKPKDVHGEDYKAGVAAGLVDLKASEGAKKKACLRCHSGEFQGNKNPHAKPFDLNQYWSKIKHPRAAKK